MLGVAINPLTTTAMIKKILLALALLAVVGLAAIYFFGSAALNKAVKRGVETYGPRVTQTSVELDAVDLSVFSGNGSLTGLRVGNPEGFNSEHIFALDQIDVAVDLGTVTSDKIILDKVHIRRPAIAYEKTARSSNLKELLENIDEFTGPADEPPADEAEAPQKQVVIRSLIIEEGTIYVGALGAGRTVALPRIEMKDVGEDKRVTLAQAVELVLAKILVNVGPALADAGQLLKEGGKAALDAAREQGGQKIDEATKEATEKAGESIKKLLGD